MYELQILFQRRRKMMARLMILALLGAAATLAILPRADAGAQPSPVIALLLAPVPVSDAAFAHLSAPRA